ncbi:hypothetical protein V3C99_000825, partial [Haemonchus contortus]|uniref:Ovule protein n=1 Tax=Haemonchus contortus TaxID=6289 RepID=A0A7I5E9M4_HAECO
ATTCSVRALSSWDCLHLQCQLFVQLSRQHLLLLFSLRNSSHRCHTRYVNERQYSCSTRSNTIYGFNSYREEVCLNVEDIWNNVDIDSASNVPLSNLYNEENCGAHGRTC